MPTRRIGREAGFTLVEVLAAVAVLSIALVASFRLINQQTRASAGLSDRVLAHWVALNAFEERQLGIGIESPRRMGGIDWRVALSDAPGPAELTRVAITVDAAGHAGAHLVGYLPPPEEEPAE